MLVTTIIIALILDVAWIAYAMANAPIVDDEDNFIVSPKKTRP